MRPSSPGTPVGVVIDTFHLWWDPEVETGYVWAADPAGVLALLKDRYETLIANHLDQSSEMFR